MTDFFGNLLGWILFSAALIFILGKLAESKGWNLEFFDGRFRPFDLKWWVLAVTGVIYALWEQAVEILPFLATIGGG